MLDGHLARGGVIDGGGLHLGVDQSRIDGGNDLSGRHAGGEGCRGRLAAGDYAEGLRHGEAARDILLALSRGLGGGPGDVHRVSAPARCLGIGGEAGELYVVVVGPPGGGEKVPHLIGHRAQLIG